MLNRRSLLSLAALSVALPAARPAPAYEIWVDLNTYVEGREGGQGTAVNRTAAFAGADGVWLITDNAYGDNNLSTSVPAFGSGIATNTTSGFTLSEWRGIVTNIGGANARIATEDNPGFDYPGHGPHPSNQSYNDAVAIKGGSATGFTLTDFFQYNESGSSAPGTGAFPANGTILSTASGTGRTVNGTLYDTQVQTYAANHGGKIGYLTRAYYTTWVGATEAAAADPLVSAGVMETVYQEGQNTAAWVNSVTKPLYSGSTLIRPAKPAYILLTPEQYRNVPALYYLKQYAPDAMASGMVKFVINNNYETVYDAANGTDGYSFFGAGDTLEGQQKMLNALRTTTPVETWQLTAGGTVNWSTRTNWAVTPKAVAETGFRSGQTGPVNKWDAAAFTSTALTGNVTVNVDTANAKALAIYFDGTANYTINGPQDITLTSYGTVGADGRVPLVAGSIPTAAATDATAYAANIIPIQNRGTGTNTISAPIDLDNTTAAGLLIDAQNTTGDLTLSGTLSADGLPIAVRGAGGVKLAGQISGGSTLTMNGTGTLTVGNASASNTGLTFTANAGRTHLNAGGTAFAAEAVLDIASGATVRATGSSAFQLNPNFVGANLTINGGGTFDIGGRLTTFTALAGTNTAAQILNNGTDTIVNNAATLVVGQNNQSGAFAGRLIDGTGVMGLRKIGSGTQTLSGNSTFGGSTNVNGGTVIAASNSALGNGPIAVNGGAASNGINAGTLAVTGGVTLANVITFQGPRNDPSNSTAVPHLLNVSGNNTISSPLTLTAAGGLGVLVRSDAGTLTLSGALNNNNNPGYARPYIFYGAGDGVISGSIANGSGSTAVTKQGSGTWSVTGTATYTGPTLVQGGTLRLGKSAFAPVLTNAGGADIQTGKLVFDYTGGTDPIATIKSLLTTSYASGFTNTASRLRSTSATTTRGLGYGDNGTAVTIAATLYGDADLDYDVDFSDFLALQTAFGQTGTRFDQGNFNYDNATDFSDFLILQTNFGQSVTGAVVAATAEQRAIITAFAAGIVPEPAALLPLVVAAAAVTGRRSRTTIAE